MENSASHSISVIHPIWQK